ncbi:MAG: LysE family translocator [Ardenticatenaceae bacterium]|nr:LysE family translocator [Ardenticatenaceae bacterium]
MIHGSQLAIFIAASVALLITPGPAVLYIITRSLDQGRTAGLISVLGIQCGTLFHIAAAALGLSALLLSSTLAFNVVKYLGAAYLIYLGIRKYLEEEPAEEIEIEVQPLRRIFYQGMVVNLLNPKTALFFFAFLPQFVNPAAGSVSGQILLLGVGFVGLALLSDGAYAMLAGSLRPLLRGSQQLVRRQRYFAGTMYIALGLTAAFVGHRK